MRWMTPWTLTAALGISISGLVMTAHAGDVTNGDFAEFDPAPAGIIEYAAQAGPAAWRFVVADSAGGRVTVAPGEAADGDAYVSFTTLTTGFGGNKLEQCVPIDGEAPVDLRYQIRGVVPTEGEPIGLSLRLNPNFYGTFDDCQDALVGDTGGNRLADGGARPNANVDFALDGSPANQWITRGPEDQATLRYEVADIPTGASWMRLSVRARNSAGTPDGATLQLDDLQVVQFGRNLLVNGSFEHRELFDGDAITPGGWILIRGGSATRRAAVGPIDFALGGDNVFYYENLTGGFGDSRMDQCFALGGTDVRPYLHVWTAQPDPDLQLRLNIAFFQDAGCSTSASPSTLETDFPLDVVPRAWTAVVMPSTLAVGSFANAAFARYSIRMRDRSGEGNNPGPFDRRVLIDDVGATAVVIPPLIAPPGGRFPDSLDVTLTAPDPEATIFVTLDGSDPDSGSMNVVSGGSLTVDQTLTLTARAAVGEALSAPRSALFTLDSTEVAPPMFDPAPGTFAAPVTVTLSTSTIGASIFFTLDGSAPGPESDSVPNGGTVLVEASSLLRARAVLGELMSEEQSGTYTIEGTGEPDVVAAPAFSPSPGEFDEPVTVTLTSATEGATIHFTLDGSDPTTESPSVANGGTVEIEETATLSAMAVLDDASSEVTSGTYTIAPAVAEVLAPEFAPPGGPFVESVTVTLTTGTEGAVIRFTLDGTDPTASSESLESGAELTFTETTELRAIADLEGELSEITTATYELQEGVTDDTLANGSFAALNPRPAEVTYGQGGGPPGWRLVVNERAENDGGRVNTGGAFAGAAWFAFNQLDRGFGDNKLEQCVAIDPTRRIDISYRVFTDFDDEDADIRVRINPNFYASFADCITAMAQDSSGNRLSGGRNNDDVDFSIGTRRSEWIRQSRAEDAGLRYEVADLPEDSSWMRLSVRARARDGGGDAISPSPLVRLDDFRVTQGTSATNLLVNGSFEQIEVRDRDFLAGGDGWFLDRDGDGSRRAAAGPMDFALVGSNVFFFEDLSENFGDSRLEQCVPLAGEILQPALFVRSAEPADGVALRVNVDFYPEADCSGEADADARLRQDFDLDIAANAWVNLMTDEMREADDYGTAQSALLSLRMRDRSGLAAAAGDGLPRLAAAGLDAAQAGDGGGGSLARRVFLDGVSLVSGVAVPDPDPDPDPPPVDPDPPPAPPPGPLRGSGCSASAEPGPFDPMLWLLSLMAALALFRRHRRRAGVAS